jgi:hypothetical protein
LKEKIRQTTSCNFYSICTIVMINKVLKGARMNKIFSALCVISVIYPAAMDAQMYTRACNQPMNAQECMPSCNPAMMQDCSAMMPKKSMRCAKRYAGCAMKMEKEQPMKVAMTQQVPTPGASGRPGTDLDMCQIAYANQQQRACRANAAGEPAKAPQKNGNSKNGNGKNSPKQAPRKQNGKKQPSTMQQQANGMMMQDAMQAQ